MSTYKPGDPKACCDICGFIYHLSELRKNWKGQKVCSKDWDPRHPQDFIKPVPDQFPVVEPRPEPPISYIELTCSVTGRSGTADEGTADCALAEVDLTYTFPSGTFDGSL